MHGSGLHQLLQEATHFAIHVLHHGQSELAEQFAEPEIHADRLFSSIPLLSEDPPVLSAAPLVITCKILHRYPAGDHDIFVGEVEQIYKNPGDNVEPLLYHRRDYKTVREGKN